MADWSNSDTTDWGSRPESPADPKGLQQSADRWAAVGPDDWAAPRTAMEGAGSWFGGRNTAGIENGWSTDFYERTFQQRNEQLDKAAASGNAGDFYDWFSREDATGVSLWDDPKRVIRAGGLRRGIRHGDVFDRGVWTGNLYDDNKEQDADLLISKLMFDGDEQKRLNRADDIPLAYRRAVQEKVTEHSEMAVHAEQAWKTKNEFDENVAEQRDEWLWGHFDWLSAGLASAGGGAALGSIGGIPGMIAGGIVGFGTGVLNQDQFTEAIALTRVQAQRAGDEEGILAAAAADLQGLGKVGQMSLSPVQNTLSGTFDLLEGGVGNGVADFYRIDPTTGERVASGKWQAAHVVSSIADSFLQFGSPAAAAAYMGTMATSAGGKAAGLALTDSVWVDEWGDYHNMQGPGEHAAAWGSAGIDMLQLGVTGSFARANASLRSQFGGAERAAPSLTLGLAERTGDTVWAKLRGVDIPTGAGVRPAEIHAGRKFFFDEAGGVAGSRLMLSAMVPSEMARWVPANYMARYAAIRRGGGMTQDDVYEAALRMSGQGGRWSDAMVNAFGEGSEEMVQAVLEPMAWGGRPVGENVYMAGAYGFASGIGMSLGPMMARPGSEARRKDYARVLEEMRSGLPIGRDEWNQRWDAMSRAEQNRAAAASPGEAKNMQQWFDAIGARRQQDVSGLALVGAMAQQQTVAKTAEDMVKSTNAAVDAALQMHFLPNTMLATRTMPGARGTRDRMLQGETPRYPVNAGAMTGYRLLELYRGKQRMLRTALKMEDSTPEEIERWTAEDEVLGSVIGWLEAQNKRLQSETDMEGFNKRIAHINNYLLQAVRTGAWQDAKGNPLPPEKERAVRDAVELNLGRHPFIEAGSIFTIVPQLDAGYILGNMHGAIGIGQAMQKVAQGDYDGDAVVSLNQVDFRTGKRANMRSGPQYASSVDAVDEQGRTTRRWVLNADAPDNERNVLREVNRRFLFSGAIDAAAVKQALASMKNHIGGMYGSILEPTFESADPMTLYLEKLDKDIRAGDANARVTFVESVLNHNGGQGYEALVRMGAESHRAEILELLQMITTGIDNISRGMNATAYAERAVLQLPREARDPIEETNLKFLRNEQARQAATMSQTAQIVYGPEGVRTSGHMHYNPFIRAAVSLALADPHTQLTEIEIELAREFMEQTSGQSSTDLEKVQAKELTTRRVRDWMRELARNLQRAAPDVMGEGNREISEGLLVWSQLSAPDVDVVDGQASTVPRREKGQEGRNSLLQLLLRKSVEIDEQRNLGADPDNAIHAKLRKLRSMTETRGKHPYTPSLAMAEVYGDMQVYDLVGDVGAHFIGANLSLNQVVNILAVMGDDARREQIRVWKKNPLYIRDGERGDPPYSASDVRNGMVNSFTVFIDTVAAIANTQHQVIAQRDRETSRSVKIGFGAIRQNLEILIRDNSAEIRRELGIPVDRVLTLEDALEFSARYPDMARFIASALPTEAFNATFTIVGNRVVPAKWVKEMLLADAPRAELMLLMEPLFDLFNVLGGTIDRQALKDNPGAARLSMGVVNESRIESRLLQLIHNLASLPSNYEISELLKVYENSNSVEAFLQKVNDNPAWLGNQPPYLPYHDAKKDFETDPRDLWNAGSGSSERMKVLNDFGQRADLLTRQQRISLQVDASDAYLISQLRELEEAERLGRTPKDFAVEALETYNALKQVLDRAIMVSTVTGGKIRSQFGNVASQNVIARQDKGKADERLAPFGEWLCVSNSEGMVPGVMQEGEKLTHLGIDAVRMDPELLMRGKSRIMMKDGRVTDIDVTNMREMLQGLADPGLSSVVRAAVFPTSRDINAVGEIQLYQQFGPDVALAEAIPRSKPLASIPSDLNSINLAQADEIISMFEGYAKRASEQSTDPKKRKLGFFPVQKLINDLLVAQTTRSDYMMLSPGQKRALNDKARIKAARALLVLSQVGPASREYLKQVTTAQMADRAQGGENEFLKGVLREAFPDTDDETQQTALMTMILANGYNEDFVDINNKLDEHRAADQLIENARATGNVQDLQDAIALKSSLPTEEYLQQQWDLVKSRADALEEGVFSPGDPVIHEFEAVFRAFDVHPHEEGEEAVRRRGMLIDFLLDGTNFPGFGADKISQDLLPDLQYENTHNPHLRLGQSDRFGPTEWKQLAVIAAKRQIATSTQRSASGVMYLTNPADDMESVRYWDRTFAYILTPLFNPLLLDAAGWLQDQVGLPRIDAVEGGEVLLRTLLNPDDLGEWNPIIPGASMDVQTALEGASVGMTIPIGGATPVSMFDTAVSQYSTWDALVTPDHLTQLTFGGNIADPVETWFDSNLSVVRLHNHFASGIDTTALEQKLRDMGVGDPDIEDIKRRISNALYEHPEEDVDTQGYKIFDLVQLQKTLIEASEWFGIEDFELGVEFVDVGKKPFSPEYVNSGLFDGVGRLTRGSGAISPFAAMMFGVSGLSKILQQQPLDFAARGGTAYTAYITSALEEVETMEKAAQSVEELMMLKALHMYLREYEFGRLQVDDLPGLFKLMKSRHVYRGEDPNGIRRVMWAEEVISFENDPKTPGTWSSGNLEMIPLTDEIFRLLVGASAKQAGHAITRPVYNIADIDRFPELTATYLAGLGLEYLGQKVPPERTELGRFARLPGTNFVDPVVAGTFRSAYSDKVDQGLLDRSGKLQWRTEHNGKGENKFDISGISMRSNDQMFKDLGVVNYQEMFQKLNIPLAGMVDTVAMRAAMSIVTGLDPTKVGDGSVHFYFQMDSRSGWNKGVLTQADVDSGFTTGEQMEKGGPTWGDLVTVNLSSILDSFGGDEEKAFHYAKKVLEAFERKGVTLILVAPTSPPFHGTVSKWVTGRGIAYTRVGGSRYVFEPITDKNAMGRTNEALADTLTSTLSVSTSSATLIFDHPSGALAGEAGAMVLDESQFVNMARRQVTLVPTSIGVSQMNQTEGDFVFNLIATPKEQTEAISHFSALLNDTAATAKLTERAAHGKVRGPENNKTPAPDPKDLAQYAARAGGRYDPGIRKWEDALKKFRDTLAEGKLPLYAGQKGLMLGDIVVLKDIKGRYFLYRLGMKVPDGHTLKGLYSGDNKVATTLPMVEESHTLPPPFDILELDPDTKGRAAYVGWKLDLYGKTGLTGLGVKLTLNPLAEEYELIEQMSDNGKGIAAIASTDSMVRKLGVQRRFNNFSAGFAVTGIDFRRYLVNALMGRSYDSTRTEGFERDWDALSPFLKDWERQWYGYSSTEIAEHLRSNILFTDQYIDFSKWADRAMKGLGQDFVVPDLMVQNSGDVNADITRIFLAALAAPEITLEHIISTPGLLTVDKPFGDRGITFMPSLLTDALDNRTLLPHVREELFKEMNKGLPESYSINPDWTVTMALRNKNTGRNEDFTGGLSFVFPVHNTESPASYAQSALMKAHSGFTPHVANVLGLALDARMIVPGEQTDAEGNRIPSRLDEAFGENKIVEFGTDPGRTFASMLTRVPDRTKSSVSWEAEPPLSQEGRRQSLKAIGDFDFRVEKTGSEWQKVLPQWQKKYDELLKLIGASDQTRTIERMIDMHVRMYLGAPGPMEDQKDWTEHVSVEAYMETLNHFVERLGKKWNIMEGGAIPHMAPDLVNVMYQLGRWAPVKREGKRGEQVVADSWEKWVSTLFGHMFDSDFVFDTLFAEELDGLLQMWKDYDRRLGVLGLSLNQQRDLMTLHRGTNEALLSLNPLVQSAEQTPLLLSAWAAGYDSISGKDRYASSLVGRREAQISGLAKRRTEWAHWKAKNKVPKSKKRQTVKDYSRNGEYYLDNAARGHALFRNLTNFSLFIRMFDPSIYASGYIEQPIRMSMEHITDILTGNYTGAGARRFAKLAESETGQKLHAAGRRAAEKLQLGSFEQMFTYQDHLIVDALAETLGADSRWLDELYDEMAYKNMIRKGEGRIGEFIEKLATRTSRAFSDPRFGTSQKAVAKRYILAAIENEVMMGGTINVPALANELRKNPMFFKQQYGKDVKQGGINPHFAGMQRVAQVRSQKQTPLGKAIMNRIDWATSSDSIGLNFLGFLAKIPFMFTRFTANALAFATGMEGWNQAAAMFFSGRERPKWLGGDEGERKYWDLNDCIETMDLRRTMIRSGSTLTMVFTLGLMAGGKLGLGGEDEEEKRRRKMAKYLNIPNILDPREPENSFTYADAIFLDSVPILGNMFRDEKGNSAIVPHWVLKQMTSPILGMSRFFQTGDFREIGYGFLDAFSVMPNSAIRLFNEADLTAKTLIDQAERSGTDDSAAGQAQTMSFLIQAFSVYEQALLENQFINTLYAGQDRYDRNPWAIPLTDENGDLILQPGTNLPQQTDALQSYGVPELDAQGNPVFDADGNPVYKDVQQGYATRKGLEGEIYQYAENHAMFAALGALFTGNGFSSPLLRSNMAVRQRKIELPASSDERVQAAIFAMYQQGGGLETYTEKEIAFKLREDATIAGEFRSDADIRAEARAIYESNQPEMGALDFITPEGEALLTDYGADRIIEGLVKGSIKLGDPEMIGISMDQEQRDRVGAVIMQRLVQDGIDRGLPQTTAEFRANRFYWGDDDYPDIPGLREILYSEEIPSTNIVKYNQLNAMYMMGPDGKPWATPFQRKSISQAFLPLPHQVFEPVKGATSLDEQGKIIDEILGINTGLHAIERIEMPPIVPNDELIEEAMTKGLEESIVPSKYRSGWRSYPRGGGGGYGGGYFQRMQALPGGTAPRIDDIQMINTASPILRRARIERARITSERGRLKQWQ